MIALLVIFDVLLAAVVVALVVMMLVHLRRVGRVTSELEASVAGLREAILAVIEDARTGLRSADELARSARGAVERFDSVTQAVQRVVEGKAVTDAASKAVGASRVTVVSLLEGVKQGLKALKGRGGRSKEELEDEQE